MRLAILFWFYKEPEICLNRLKLIKKHNPKAKIFGLYGGNINNARAYKTKLKNYLDDFYCSSLCDKSNDYKWIHGDLMILDWYEKRGKEIDGWDSVAVIQWDALVLGNIEKQLPKIKEGELFISGMRVLDKNIEEKWSWTKNGSKERKNFLGFKKYIKDRFGYKNKLLCSLFIFQVFPREFFKKWRTIKDKEIGMLEYKIPTYAKIFNTPIYKQNLGALWFNKKAHNGNTPLNAIPMEIRKEYIQGQLKKKHGFRIFHPYFKIWKED